jgi:Glycosyltransferase
VNAGPLRVLFVLEHYFPYVGGVETLFQSLAEDLAARGHAVTVVTSWLPGTEKRVQYNGVNVFRVGVPRMFRRYFFSLLAIPSAIRHAADCDVIHSIIYNAAVPAAIAKVLRRKPAVLSVLEVFANQWNELPGINRWLGYGFRLFESSVLRLPYDHYACISDFTRARLLRFVKRSIGRASTIYPPFDHDFWDPARHAARDLRRELGLPPEAFLYLYFGRPGVSKGIEYLLRAVPLVRLAIPVSHLVMILPKEPAAHYERIRSEISRLGLSRDLTILDPQPRGDLPGYLLGANCIVVPSISEGFGYSALEAASLGCTVVATRGHAVEEILGRRVVLVEPRSPESLADGITRSASFRGSAALPRFEPSRHTDSFERLYRSLIGSWEGRTADF